MERGGIVTLSTSSAGLDSEMTREPSTLSLSKGRFFFSDSYKKGRPFDKLRAGGKG